MKSTLFNCKLKYLKYSWEATCSFQPAINIHKSKVIRRSLLCIHVKCFLPAVSRNNVRLETDRFQNRSSNIIPIKGGEEIIINALVAIFPCIKVRLIIETLLKRGYPMASSSIHMIVASLGSSLMSISFRTSLNFCAGKKISHWSVL